MVKKNLFKYSSVLMCVVLTAASLVACGNSSAATTGTDTAVKVTDISLFHEIDDCADELRWIEEIVKQLKEGA